MKITQKIIDDLTVALAHTKKDGTENWKDGEEIEGWLAGTFANDKFISILNRTKNPVVSAAPPPNFDYERGTFKDDKGEVLP